MFSNITHIHATECLLACLPGWFTTYQGFFSKKNLFAFPDSTRTLQQRQLLGLLTQYTILAAGFHHDLGGDVETRVRGGWGRPLLGIRGGSVVLLHHVAEGVPVCLLLMQNAVQRLHHLGLCCGVCEGKEGKFFSEVWFFCHLSRLNIFFLPWWKTDGFCYRVKGTSPLNIEYILSNRQKRK